MKLNNKGISIVELLVVMFISSILLFNITQSIINLSKIQSDSTKTNLIYNEGSLLINEINYRVKGIIPESTQPCINNEDCITLVFDLENKLQVEFIDDIDKGKKVKIIKTKDGNQTTEFLTQASNMKNVSISKVDCELCTRGTVYIIEFQLYFEDKFTKTFSTSFVVK